MSISRYLNDTLYDLELRGAQWNSYSLELRRWRWQSVLYDEGRRWQLSTLGCHFVAGDPTSPALLCAQEPRRRWLLLSPASRPLGTGESGPRPLNCGAAVRIAPLFGSDLKEHAQQFKIEFRVAAATANPYLALAILIQAGLDGIRSPRQIDATDARPLPTSLMEALTLLEESDATAEWLGAELLSGYLLFKQAEVQGLRNPDESDICRRYTEVY